MTLNFNIFKDRFITFYNSAVSQRRLSYHDFFLQAAALACVIESKGLPVRTNTITQAREKYEQLLLFWGAILSNMVPVPITFADSPQRKHKLKEVKDQLSNSIVLDEEILEEAFAFLGKNKSDNLSYKERFLKNTAIIDNSDTFFWQFSSGSTSSPKGIAMSWSMIQLNIQNTLAAINCDTDEERFLSWMPMTHDFGIILGHLAPLLKGSHQCLLGLNYFLRKPQAWFEIAAEEGSSLLTTTNFANHFFTSRCNNLIKKPDLSKIKAIINGAEPIIYSVTQTSKNILSSWGLKPGVLTAAYGLAEGTLVVTIKDQTDECNFLEIDSRSIGMGEKVNIISQIDTTKKTKFTPHSIIVANVGKPISSLKLEIVDDFQIPLNELEVGNIFIQGPTVTNRILNHQGLNTIDKGYVTGDIGFTFNGCLYWLGRTKDHFKINGLSYFSNEIETYLSDILGISPGQCVVTKNDFANNDEIIVFLRVSCVKTYESLAQSIFEICRKQFGFEIARFIKIAQVPRTTSGKIQRFQLMRDYLNQQESSKNNFSHPLVLNNKSSLSTSSIIVNQLLQTYLGDDGLCDKDISIQDLELSSLDLLVLVNELSKKLSISVSVSDIYSHPNITDFRNFLISSHQQSLSRANV